LRWRGRLEVMMEWQSASQRTTQALYDDLGRSITRLAEFLSSGVLPQAGTYPPGWHLPELREPSPEEEAEAERLADEAAQQKAPAAQEKGGRRPTGRVRWRARLQEPQQDGAPAATPPRAHHGGRLRVERLRLGRDQHPDHAVRVGDADEVEPGGRGQRMDPGPRRVPEAEIGRDRLVRELGQRIKRGNGGPGVRWRHRRSVGDGSGCQSGGSLAVSVTVR
jgi:hypothetical protein